MTNRLSYVFALCLILLIYPATSFAATAQKAYRVAFFSTGQPAKRMTIDGSGT